MIQIQSAYLAHQRRRWMRLDAFRFVRPDWRRFVKAGFGQELPFALYERKYSPDQPRVPAGNPDGGQWTTVGIAGGGSETGKRPGISTPGVAMSDASPDPLKPGAQYAQLTRIEIDTSALTGIQRIDDTTVRLTNTLARVMDVVKYTPDLGPALYGTEIHTIFAAALRLQQLPGVDVEPTFGLYYSAKDSVRPDAVLRNDAGDIVAIYDVKTGGRGIDPIRAANFRLRAGVGNDVPVIVLSVPYGVHRKSLALEMHQLGRHFAVAR
jgi:hypothetical protein